jgi:hypothetical protein
VGPRRHRYRVDLLFNVLRPRAQEMTMDGWWTEIDDQVRRCLEHGAMAPRDIARQLDLSEGAVISVLSLLVQEGKLRIARVELTPREDNRQLPL